MKHTILAIFLVIGTLQLSAQSTFIFPDSVGWNILNENQELSFDVRSTHQGPVYFSIEGVSELEVEFDSLGHFSWTPSFDLADRVERTRDFTFIFQQQLPDNTRERQEITFTVNHVNRPPVVEELPFVYVRPARLSFSGSSLGRW